MGFDEILSKEGIFEPCLDKALSNAVKHAYYPEWVYLEFLRLFGEFKESDKDKLIKLHNKYVDDYLYVNLDIPFEKLLSNIIEIYTYLRGDVIDFVSNESLRKAEEFKQEVRKFLHAI